MDERPDLLLFVHGLNYDAKTYDDLTAISAPGVAFEVYKYGWRSSAFLFSNRAARELTDRLYLVVRELQTSGRYRTLNVMAHSLGTQIVMGVLDQYPDLEIDTVFLTAAIISRDSDLPAQRPKTLFVNYLADDDVWLTLIPPLAAVLNMLGNLPVRVGSAGKNGLSNKGVLNRMAYRSGHRSGRTRARLISDALDLLPGRRRRTLLCALMQRREAVLRDTLVPSEGAWRHHSIIPTGIQKIAYLTTRTPDKAAQGVPEQWVAGRRGLVFVEGAAGAGKTTALMSVYSNLVDLLLQNRSTFLPIWISWPRISGVNQISELLDGARTGLADVADAIHVFVDGIDESEANADDWAALHRLSTDKDVAAILVSGRSERAFENIPASVRSSFSENVTILGFDAAGARSFLLSPTGGEATLGGDVVERILLLPMVKEGDYYNPLRLFMARMICASRSEADIAELSDPFQFYSEFVDLILERNNVRGATDVSRAKSAAAALGTIVNIRTSGLNLSDELRELLEETWAQHCVLLQRFDVLAWNAGIAEAEFKHDTFSEYFFVRAAIDGLNLTRDDGVFELLLRTPMHQSLAGFVKGRLASLTPHDRISLARHLGALTEDGAARSNPPGGSADTARLNGLIYMASRLGEPSRALLEELWRYRRESILASSPEAFVTLLSGISVLGSTPLEADYIGFALKQPYVLRVLVGWHVVYYGDREKPKKLDFSKEHVVFGAASDWSRTKKALASRMQSDDLRETLLFAFHALAYMACTAVLSSDDLDAARHLVREAMNRKRLTTERRAVVSDMLDASWDLICLTPS